MKTKDLKHKETKLSKLPIEEMKLVALNENEATKVVGGMDWMLTADMTLFVLIVACEAHGRINARRAAKTGGINPAAGNALREIEMSKNPVLAR